MEKRHAAPRVEAQSWWVLVLGLLLLSGAAGAAGPARNVALLLSQPGGVYQEVAQHLRDELQRDCERCSVRLQRMDEEPAREGDDLLVTLGVAALESALASPGSVPVLALLVPRLTYDSLVADEARAGRQRAVTAIHLDQPLSRQLRLIRNALPQVQRIGVLLGAAYASQADELQRGGRAAGFALESRAVETPGKLFATLAGLAPDVDALLLLPDPQVVNASTLQSLFLYTYRRRLPIIAYSDSLVKAGALLGLHATPAQIAADAAKLARELLRQDRLRAPPARPPETYTVQVNRNVARSLDIDLPSAQSLAAALAPEPTP